MLYTMRLEIFDQECPDLGDILTVCPQTRGTHSWFGAGTSWDGRCAWGLLWPGERLGSRCTERTGASSAPGSVHGAAGATSTALSECMCKERAILVCSSVCQSVFLSVSARHQTSLALSSTATAVTTSIVPRRRGRDWRRARRAVSPEYCT
jgi:hypothetical protein